MSASAAPRGATVLDATALHGATAFDTAAHHAVTNAGETGPALPPTADTHKVAARVCEGGAARHAPHQPDPAQHGPACCPGAGCPAASALPARLGAPAPEAQDAPPLDAAPDRRLAGRAIAPAAPPPRPGT